MAGQPRSAGTETERWLAVRRLLAQRRSALGAAAAALYPNVPRVAGTDLLGRPEWLPGVPVDLAAIGLRWQPSPPAPAWSATGPGAVHVLPPMAAGNGNDVRYASYAQAVGALDRPAFYEDRVCYRMVEARLAGRPEFTFGQCGYFDGVSPGQAVAHEFAAAAGPIAGHPGPDLSGLPLRAAAGDPCDLTRRVTTAAIATLTLRRDVGGSASFLLHWRDPARVNHAGGMFMVLPTGIFQPITGTPAGLRADFSLWRCLVREFSEELLGASEEYPISDGVLDYAGWEFHEALTRARESGALTVRCLGIGVDPLTLATDILTVAVFDGDVFDALFAGLVLANAEGSLVTKDGSAAIGFTAENIARFTNGSEPVQSAGAALLRLAWQHRRDLLGRAT
jgi:hypothetical protein